MGVIARLENARINFAAGLWTAGSSVPGGKKKFNADFIITDDTKVMLKQGTAPNVVWKQITIDEAQKMARAEAFSGDMKKANVWFEALDARQKSVRDGDKNVDKEGDVRNGYEGNWYVAAKNAKRPPVRLADRTEVESPEESPINSGDYVNVVIELYAWLKQGQKGLFATLLGTQFVRKGDAIGGGNRSAAADDFEELAEGADASDFG